VDNSTGENCIVVASGANHLVSPQDLADHEDLFASAEVVVLQLELPYPTVSAAAAMARKHECRVVLDTAPAGADLPADLFRVDILTPNQSEAEILTGRPAASLADAQTAAVELLKRGPGAVVLKLGASGSLVVTAAGPARHVPAYKVHVVDTTGAGDAFTAGLAVALAEGQPLDQAAALGNAAGALAATRPGAQAAMPSRQEVAELMRQQT
jgi:ribokinase